HERNIDCGNGICQRAVDEVTELVLTFAEIHDSGRSIKSHCYFNWHRVIVRRERVETANSFECTSLPFAELSAHGAFARVQDFGADCLHCRPTVARIKLARSCSTSLYGRQLGHHVATHVVRGAGVDAKH